MSEKLSKITTAVGCMCFVCILTTILVHTTSRPDLFDAEAERVSTFDDFRNEDCFLCADKAKMQKLKIPKNKYDCFTINCFLAQTNCGSRSIQKDQGFMKLIPLLP
jgi:hypothetical protein